MSEKRRVNSNERRARIIERDNSQCVNCKAKVPRANLHITLRFGFPLEKDTEHYYPENALEARCVECWLLANPQESDFYKLIDLLAAE